LTTASQEIARAGRQHACTFDTLNNFVRSLNEAIGLGISQFKTGSGLSSNDGGGLNPLPARSDGLDNVDGGPDAAFYIQVGVIQQVSILCRF
jgi:hypothetical protein